MTLFERCSISLPAARSTPSSHKGVGWYPTITTKPCRHAWVLLVRAARSASRLYLVLAFKGRCVFLLLIVVSNSHALVDCFSHRCSPSTLSTSSMSCSVFATGPQPKISGWEMQEGGWTETSFGKLLVAWKDAREAVLCITGEWISGNTTMEEGATWSLCSHSCLQAAQLCFAFRRASWWGNRL